MDPAVFCHPTNDRTRSAARFRRRFTESVVACCCPSRSANDRDNVHRSDHTLHSAITQLAREERCSAVGAHDDGPVTSLDRRAGLGHHRGTNMTSPAMLVPSNLRTFAGEKNSLGGTMPPKTPKKRSISDCRPDNGRRIPSSVR